MAAERSRLQELRLLAHEDRAVLGLLLGRHAPVAAELESLTRQHPLRERLWALRAVALAGSGRQAEATAVLGEVRALLDVELGLEPGAELRAVQTAVLRQAALPTLARTPAPAAAVDDDAPGTGPGGSPGGSPSWPLVGRESEAAVLGDLVDRVAAGRPGAGLAALTGEPGIGKSRLCAVVTARAATAGVPTVTGRCSQDEGAPPLWPWAQVLAALGAELPTATGAADGAADFRAWQSVVRLVVDAAAERGLVVVLEDLHWADASTLRVLRMLVETVAAADEQDGRLLVVATWREHPPPSGALADVAEAFGRAHAVRLRLGGVTDADAARLVAAVTRAEPAADDVAELCRRTGGNPFFLVEYARLARDDGDLGRLLAERRTPAAVHDVVSRRLDRLGTGTVDLVRQAAVLGRLVEIDVLAAAAELTEEAVLDGLEPAVAAGLMAEDDVDRFRFTHALVRDTAIAALPRSRQARIHARAAEVLSHRPDHPDRVAEIARHWAAAGPRHRRQAWQAAAAAARAAASVHAHVEARELLADALAGQSDDHESSPRERFGLLLDLAAVLSRAGRRLELRDVAHQAYAVAAEVGDPLLEADAVTLTTSGALWQGAWGVDEAMVGTPAGHPRPAPPRRLRRPVPGDARAGDRDLLRRHAPGARCARGGGARDGRPAGRRRAAAVGVPPGVPRDVAGRATRRAGSSWPTRRSGWPTTSTTSCPGSRRAPCWPRSPPSSARSTSSMRSWRPRGPRPRRATTSMRSWRSTRWRGPWLGMRGETERFAALITHLTELDAQVSISGIDDAVPALHVARLLWEGRHAEMLGLVELVDEQSLLPTGTFRAAMLCRAGDLAAGREYVLRHPERIARSMADDTWFSPLGWAGGAETAAHLGDPELGATAYALLRPLAGRSVSAGSGMTVGPADMFLALAAVATGERDLAAGHAERAAEQCERWRVPLAAQWVRRERERWGI